MDYINVIFVRHAECMHTAVEGLPSAIMPQFFNDATRASVAPLVARFDDDALRAAQGKWKACAANANYAVLTKADSPLLPSELAARAHEPRLTAIFAIFCLAIRSRSHPLGKHHRSSTPPQ